MCIYIYHMQRYIHIYIYIYIYSSLYIEHIAIRGHIADYYVPIPASGMPRCATPVDDDFELQEHPSLTRRRIEAAEAEDEHSAAPEGILSCSTQEGTIDRAI